MKPDALQDWPCVVISRDVPDNPRLAAFGAGLPTPWPLAVPMLYPAVWGELTGKATDFRETPGAWGCWRTHCRLWEDMLCREWPGVVVFEDDAVFRPDFAARLAAFLAAAPDDWDQLYFGGQHLRGKWGEAGPGVRRAINVNRTHAYAVRATDRTRAGYWRLCSMAPARCAGARGHVDYVLGELHETGQLTAYCPAEWLCGQAAGVSATTGKTCAENYW